ncbi:glycosyltransferase family 39 protein [Seleniivibrio sp.]|uniref:ArnT family glycosyltransferase n=1 Tax=Seleniivibrio sp. TaxID=2898801 RepID=UPI0025F06B86|nr:glycosyltransferase family 39 protein [Seleniivibrio sp.]MCD8554334.1 glycosyltransferase family 39 protein [Seleniivibrio sp.]
MFNSVRNWTVLFFVVLFAGRIGDGDLRGDSINYASISKNVLTGDNPLILTLNGDLYMNKPPLFFWLNALFIKIFGATVFGVKIAVVIAVAGIAWVLYTIAKKLFDDDDIAVAAPMMFFFSYVVYKNTQMLKMEALVSFFIIASVMFMVFYIRQQNRLYAVAAGLFMGLAVFTKGPIGYTPLITAFAFIFFGKGINRKRYLLDLLVMLVVSIPVYAWWYAYVLIKNPYFYEHYFLDQNFARFGIEGSQKRYYIDRPIWQYLKYMFLHGIYFTPFLIYGIYRLFRDGKITEQIKYMLVTTGVFFVIIHFARTKEHRYLYEFYLFASVFAAYGFTVLFRRRISQWVRATVVFLLALYAFMPPVTKPTTYDALLFAKKVAAERGIPVVAAKSEITNQNDVAAMHFYFDSYLDKRPADGDYIEIVNKKTGIYDAERLYKFRDLAVYLVTRKESAL